MILEQIMISVLIVDINKKRGKMISEIIEQLKFLEKKGFGFERDETLQIILINEIKELKDTIRKT